MDEPYWKGLSCTALALLLLACTSNPIPKSTTMDRIETSLPPAKPLPDPNAAVPTPIPMEVQNALLPSLQKNAVDVLTGSGERFDVSANDLDAKEFFMGLVSDTPTNLVVHPDVTGRISLNLKKVTLDEVLETTRTLYGYEYKKSSAGYQIFPKQLLTRIYQLNYLNLDRSGKSLTIVSSGQIAGSGSDSSHGSSNSNSNSSSDSGNSSADQSNTSNTIASSSIETKSESNFWEQFTASIEAMIGKDSDRRVVINPQTGVMIVHAMPDELHAIEEYLQATQRILRRQVYIEAKILEVNLSDGFQSGINWAALAEPKPGQTVTIGQTGGGSLFSTGDSEIAGNTGVLDPNALSQVVGTATSAFGGVFSIAANLNDFTAFIELLKVQGDVQVLSSPRISTVNNQKAVIKVGTDEFFVTDISNNTTTSTSTSNAQDITLTPFFSGIALDVTPQIDAQNNIVLHIHPSISNVEDQSKTITINSETQTLPLALSSIRETDSIVQTKSGKVIVIGGLMQDKHKKSVGAVPLLGEIPGIGVLFKHNQEASVKSELVILLRAVVAEDEQWQPILEGSTDSFQSIRR